MLSKDRIYNQNCISGMKEISNDSVDMIITSPPYDNLREYNHSSVWNYAVFQKTAIEMFRILKPGGVTVWIVNDATIKKSESGSSFRQALFFKEIGFLLHDTMIWQKISPNQHKNRYIPSFEYMFVLSKSIPPKTVHLICDRKNKHGGRPIHGSARQKDGTTRPLSSIQKKKTVKQFGARLNIWDIPPVKNNTTNHPAPFPIILIMDHIQTWSEKDDLILDPFIGSGTTALAAIRTQRHFIGFEIDKSYFAEAQERIELELRL